MGTLALIMYRPEDGPKKFPEKFYFRLGNKTNRCVVFILMAATDGRSKFEDATLQHLDAAYNLAGWLTCDASDAEDVVQEAYLRAFRFFDGFRGGDSRAWLLRIVRNTCYTWLQKIGLAISRSSWMKDITDRTAMIPKRF